MYCNKLKVEIKKNVKLYKTLHFKITSLCLFLSLILLLCTNNQFIAFNEFSATGKYPAIFFYVSIVLLVLYIGLFSISICAFWSTFDVMNNWNNQTTFVFKLVIYLNIFYILNRNIAKMNFFFQVHTFCWYWIYCATSSWYSYYSVY